MNRRPNMPRRNSAKSRLKQAHTAFLLSLSAEQIKAYWGGTPKHELGDEQACLRGLGRYYAKYFAVVKAEVQAAHDDFKAFEEVLKEKLGSMTTLQRLELYKRMRNPDPEGEDFITEIIAQSLPRLESKQERKSKVNS